MLRQRLRRTLRALTRTKPQEPALPQPPPLSAGPYDSWLRTFWDEELARIDRLCAGAGAEAFAHFRELDANLWALLLTQEYEVYPNIKALLPDVPAPELQTIWNGASGIALAAQSCAFYELLRRLQAAHGERPLADCAVLDFGCGWGRLTRFLARDVEPGSLYGCDPVPAILDEARRARVPAELAQSDHLPDAIPFDRRFDLAYAFSVFTHLSEPAHLACLRALHAALAPGGLLVTTIRPPEFLRLHESLHPALAKLGPSPGKRLEEPLYLFAPREALPVAGEGEPTEPTYGAAVVTLAYVREHWTGMFELVDIDLSLGDAYQVVLTLRRR